MKWIIASIFIPLLAFGAGKIIDADIAPSGTANIARNKLAASTAHNAATFDASGYLAAGIAPGASGNILSSNGTDWISSSSTAALSIGALDAQAANANGLALVSNVLSAQSADSTHPGLINNTTQTLGAGTKTIANIVDSGLTASTVPYADAGKLLVSSSVTPTELGYVSGVTSAIQTQINGKQASGNYITALTGDVTASGPGSVAATVAKIQGTTVSGTTGTTNVVFSSSPTLSNPVVGTQATSDNSTLAASTAYVQTALAQLNPAAAVVAASTVNIPGTYTNAVGGVCIGDTFRVTATTAFSPDGVTLTLGQRFLMKDQSSSFQDGVWTLTTAANVGVLGALLTRALDFDSSADINAGSIVPVVSGTVNAGSSWYQTAAVTTCNSDSQTWTQFQKASSAYASSALTNTHIFVGNASNVATDVAMSAGATISNTGVITLGNPGASTLGGVQSKTCSASNWISTISTGGVETCTQPAFTDISGTATVAQGGTGQTSYTDGQLLIGNTSGNTITKATITAGSGVTITNGNGSITIAATGGSTFSQQDVYLGNGLGHGSVNTKIRTYSNVRRNTGSNITVAQSSTNGDSMTINTAGAYMFCASDAATSGASVAITVNDSALTTSASTPITYAQGKRDLNIGVTTGDYKQSCWFGILAVNDIVRMHDDGSNSGTDDRSYFFGTYLGTGTSSAYLENGNGYGSTNTKIRKYSNSRGTTGTNITVNQSAANGDNLTVNANGIYAGCIDDNRAGSSAPVGITVNDSALTTTVTSINYSNGLRAYEEDATNNMRGHVCFVGYLNSGDIVRMHGDGSADSTASDSYFYLTEITDTSTQSAIFLSAGAGHGTTATKNRTFTNLRQNFGNSMQYQSSALFGDSIKINVEGEYIVCYNDQLIGGSATNIITVNGTAGTTNASTPILYTSNGLRAGGSANANYQMPQACFGSYFYVGDTVMAQDDGANNLTTDEVTLSIVQTR